MLKKTLMVSAIAATLSSGAAMAEISGNIGIASNYIWRGMTQTVDQAAVSGGLDYSHASGLYAGLWVSNVDFSGLGDGYENDYYVGYAGKAGEVGYDVGLITYAYPVTPDFNFTEFYVKASFGPVGLSVNQTIDNAHGNDGGVFAEDDLYISVSADITDSISVYAGNYSFDAPGADVADYSHFGVSVSKDDFTFAIDKNDADDPAAYDSSADNMRMTVSWSKAFEL